MTSILNNTKSVATTRKYIESHGHVTNMPHEYAVYMYYSHGLEVSLLTNDYLPKRATYIYISLWLSWTYNTFKMIVGISLAEDTASVLSQLWYTH